MKRGSVDKEMVGGGGGGALPHFYYFTVQLYLLYLLYLILQSLELAMQDPHPSLYSTKTLYHLYMYISDSF